MRGGRLSQSSMSDALLPGVEQTSIQTISSDITTNSVTMSSVIDPPTAVSSDFSCKEKVWVVARCVLIACLASFVSGMNAGFSSPTLVELENPNSTIPVQLLQPSSKLSGLFGVSCTIKL